MKKLVLLFALLSVLASASAAHAVTLQQGWYAQFEYVSYGGWLPGHEPVVEYGNDWFPASTLGQKDGFAVTEGRYPFTDGRTVTISRTDSFAPGVLFEDQGINTFGEGYYQEVDVQWHTNYDANRLQLRAYRRRPGSPDLLAWTQSVSGNSHGSGNIWRGMPEYSLYGDKLVFQLVVVPEPASLQILALSTLALIAGMRRRQQ